MVRQDADGSVSTERRAATRRGTEHVHDTEIIFILPSLQMHLKTEHMQGEHEPLDGGAETDVTWSDILIALWTFLIKTHALSCVDSRAVMLTACLCG